MDETTATIWELIAFVDQKMAEYKDPETPEDRKQELLGQLSDIYKLLKELERGSS